MISALGEAEVDRSLELEENLVYSVSSRTTKATQRNLVSRRGKKALLN